MKTSFLLVIPLRILAPLLISPQDQLKPLHINPQCLIFSTSIHIALPFLDHLQMQHLPLPAEHPQHPLRTRETDARLLRLHGHHVEDLAGVGGVVGVGAEFLFEGMDVVDNDAETRVGDFDIVDAGECAWCEAEIHAVANNGGDESGKVVQRGDTASLVRGRKGKT